MRDSFIRAAFHVSVLKPAHDCGDTIVIDELGLRNGESRADIAVLNGKLIGYEIKTEKDNLNRLQSQVVAYNEVFDKVYIVTGKSHFSKVLEIVPEWWGVYVIEPRANLKINFTCYRKGKINRQKNTVGLAQLLWKMEVKEILDSLFEHPVKASTTKEDLNVLLSAKCSPKILSKITLQYLKSRQGWRTSQRQLL